MAAAVELSPLPNSSKCTRKRHTFEHAPAAPLITSSMPDVRPVCFLSLIHQLVFILTAVMGLRCLAYSKAAPLSSHPLSETTSICQTRRSLGWLLPQSKSRLCYKFETLKMQNIKPARLASGAFLLFFGKGGRHVWLAWHLHWQPLSLCGLCAGFWLLTQCYST